MRGIPLEPHLDIGNKVFQWKVIRSAFMQARQVMVDDIQSFNEGQLTKSYIAPALINPLHPMFSRHQEDGEIPTQACPLSVPGTELAFRDRSDSVPPSPYSDDPIDLEEEPEEEEEEENFSKKRRFSDEPPRNHHRHYHEDRRQSFAGHGHHHHYKRHRQY